MARHHCNTITPMQRGRPPGHRGRATPEAQNWWQNPPKRLDYQDLAEACQTTITALTEALTDGDETARREQAQQLEELQPEQSQDPRQ